MSIVMEILEDLWDTSLYYKGIRVNMLGVPILRKSKQQHLQNSFDITLARLAKKGLVEIKSGRWSITKSGKEYFENKKRLSIRFSSPFVLNAPKNLLLMFDVPESRKSERNWLRWHLREFQYLMIQKSVWVGPSPLPKKFAIYLRELGLNHYIKTFKLSRPFKFNDQLNKK